MLKEQMSLAEVYRLRDLVEQDGTTVYFYNVTGQRYIVRLVPPQELKTGARYPILIERQDGQLLRTYMLASQKVFIDSEES